MIKIDYFDERELLVRREIETKTLKRTEAKGTQVLPENYQPSLNQRRKMTNQTLKMSLITYEERYFLSSSINTFSFIPNFMSLKKV